MIKKPYEKNGRLYVEIKREYTKIDDFLKNEIKNLSLGHNLDKIVKKRYQLIKYNNLLNEKRRVFWTNYLDKKMSWER